VRGAGRRFLGRCLQHGGEGQLYGPAAAGMPRNRQVAQGVKGLRPCGKLC
jgi:hypothetical protein